jgi:MFS family permease
MGAFLDARNRLGLMLVLLFCFNLSRGISSCAWLPWISALVPAELRGRYLARDQAVQNLASFFTFMVAATCLMGDAHPRQFSVLFAYSAVAGAVSLSFLKRIPDAEMAEEVRASKTGVPWLEMASYPPFKKLLYCVTAYAVAYGGMTAFTVAFLKSAGGLSEGKILLITSTTFLGGLSSLWLMGHRLDRLGSKPVLSFCGIVWLGVLAGWIGLSGQAWPLKIWLVLVLQVFMGLLAALAQMSNVRLAMAIIPVMGRNHFFAIYSVVANVTLGLAPIGWGLLIDAVGGRAPVWLGLAWNRYTIFFASAGLAFAVMLAVVGRLHEPKAASLEELLREILIQSPQRFWVRFWPRGGA